MIVFLPSEINRPAAADLVASLATRLLAAAEIDAVGEQPHDREEVQQGLRPTPLDTNGPAPESATPNKAANARVSQVDGFGIGGGWGF